MMDYRYRRPPDRHNSGFTLLELLIVLAMFGIVAAISIPMGQTAVGGYKLAGQAHAISYQIGLAKMRAASSFTRARVFVDLGNKTHRLEAWNATTKSWTTEGGTEQLPRTVALGYGDAATPPPDTQGTIGQAAACLAGVDATSAALPNSSCVVFNSRGIPIDATGAPTNKDAIYLTDGTAVYATTVSAAGMTQLWWTPTRSTSWQRQ